MAQRRSHGTAAQGGALVVQEVRPFDELQRPDPQPDATGPVDRRPDGRIASSDAARELGRRGGLRSQFRARILRRLGLAELAADHAFAPYEAAGQEWVDAYVRSLCDMFDGVCGEGPQGIVQTAGIQIAASRYLYDLGKLAGDAKLLGQASSLGDASRVNTGAAYELQAREADARKRRGRSPQVPAWMMPDEGASK